MECPAHPMVQVLFLKAPPLPTQRHSKYLEHSAHGHLRANAYPPNLLCLPTPLPTNFHRSLFSFSAIATQSYSAPSLACVAHVHILRWFIELVSSLSHHRPRRDSGGAHRAEHSTVHARSVARTTIQWARRALEAHVRARFASSARTECRGVGVRTRATVREDDRLHRTFGKRAWR